jgi:hypothetical protein
MTGTSVELELNYTRFVEAQEEEKDANVPLSHPVSEMACHTHAPLMLPLLTHIIQDRTWV